MSAVTIEELIADWRVRRNALDREIAFFEEGHGVIPAPKLRMLRRMALELDRLIARHTKRA